MDDTISRRAAIEAIKSLYPDKPKINFMDNFSNWEKKNKQYIECEQVIDNLPSAQPEITDGQAIEHLQDSGWMQNHDKQMYEMGLRENLSDDGDSYDALLPSEQPNLDEWCTDCKEYDSEKHRCPRWNRVIRETAEEVRKNAEPRWIPVTERLPEEGQRVLVTDEDGEIDIAHTIDYSDIGEGIGWWSHDYRCYPIAWRECPKPYERSEDE